ncbi:MAG TPA: helix-turn-helix domain-containing protein [Eoetvoesiella sp.]|jgi:CRP/FNR family transcriptional regulator|uniref:helix-turn-helix domain-containing protein n=1 Tax=Eoetvoesiella sp. TaxID=1966355 RepID=UPI002CDB9668|nr:helix-turn-helix domain-containing protein [Eoetvoesiella sp.]HWK61632.1 helix-turn-helix domain-containing protein [Eoetvoesiella sp.]
MPKKISLAPEAPRCSACMLNTLCLPTGMAENEVAQLDKIVNERIRIPKGKALFQQGDKAEALYGIRYGSIKTLLEDANGQVQITGFLLPGEIVGLDGFLEKHQLSNAVALEDTEVCVAHIEDMDRIMSELPSLKHQLRRLTSHEIKRSQQLVMSLGVLRSEQRLAAFLLSISQRLAALGYSSSEFVLRMSREEIGNYLGLTLETVSRLFSRFARENLLRVQQREVQLLDMPALRELAGTDCG